MSVFGIICETNPMHNGHKLLIDSAKALGGSHIVCVMSGNTTQRGEFAIADKYVRAEALLGCGADLVLELPFPWCSGSAEYFSKAAVFILKNMCDTVIFGSECGDIDKLKRGAAVAQGDIFRERYEAGMSEGKPAAGLYFDLLEEFTGHSFSSNDLLGIEYIKADGILSGGLDFKTILRQGDPYTSSVTENISYPSAMAIRKLWSDGNTEGINAYMPKKAADVYMNAIKNGNIIDVKSLDMMYLSFFRTHTGEDFKDIAGAAGGVANRICDMSHRACGYDELSSLISNKRYTDSNIKRTMLYCMSGVRKTDLEDLPRETLLLAANSKGRELLSKNRKSGMRIVTKPADLNAELRQNVFMKRIDGIYTLLQRQKRPTGFFAKKRPYIE